MAINIRSQVRGTSGFPVLRFIFLTVFIAGFLYGFIDFSGLWTKLPPLPGTNSANSSEARPRNDGAQPADTGTEFNGKTGNDTPDETPAHISPGTQQHQDPPDDLRLNIDLNPDPITTETSGETLHLPFDFEDDFGEDENTVETGTVEQPVPETKDPEQDLFTYTRRDPEPDQEITDADVKRADELLVKAKELMREWAANRSSKAMAEAYKLLQQSQQLYRRAQTRNPSDKYIKDRIQTVNELLYIAMKHVTIQR